MSTQTSRPGLPSPFEPFLWGPLATGVGVGPEGRGSWAASQRCAGQGGGDGAPDTQHSPHAP